MADNALPHGDRVREEIARIEIGQTDVAPLVARRLLIFFLTALAIVPVLETLGSRWVGDDRVSLVWSRLTAMPARVAADVDAEIAAGRHSSWDRVSAANRAVLSGLAAFERGLDHESVLGHVLRPSAQRMLSGWPGAGNERVYIGRDGWLFYRPDVEYLTGRGFLHPSVMRRRVVVSREWTKLPRPDPRPAILEFHRQLVTRGIALIVVPTPGKPSIHPEKLASAYENRGEPPLQNPSYAAFVENLGGAGVLVFDAATVLSQARQSGPQYLATDTHWRPEAMELVAERLAAFVSEHVNPPAIASPGYRTEDRVVANHGDTSVMLDLPAARPRYPRERVLIRRVVGSDGDAWRPDRRADVLVLGDSFSNIYSLASMNWGDSAGLIEQLSYALGRPIDRIVQNDDAAYATRAMLARDGPERLAGKRVLIWQFAERELAFGDWR
jgi:alginate O-acetyltransferase complex protein AlgJ